MDSVQVPPLVWDDWHEGYEYCTSRGTPHTQHQLWGTGKTTNGYRYKVVADPLGRGEYDRQLLGKVLLRPTCCRGMRACPIGKREIPQHCRDHLRQEAERLAYEVWLQYIKNLVGIQ